MLDTIRSSLVAKKEVADSWMKVSSISCFGQTCTCTESVHFYALVHMRRRLTVVDFCVILSVILYVCNSIFSGVTINFVNTACPKLQLYF